MLSIVQTAQHVIYFTPEDGKIMNERDDVLKYQLKQNPTPCPYLIRVILIIVANLIFFKNMSFSCIHIIFYKYKIILI